MRHEIEEDLFVDRDVRFCKSCIDETLHLVFANGDKEVFATCASCLTRWTEVKPAQLFTCENCRTQTLRTLDSAGAMVLRAVKPCFKPDRDRVELIEYLCSSCIPEDVVEHV